jgi:membrane-associated phospholipid phosphatase
VKTSLVILAVGATAALMTTALSISRRTNIDPIDPEPEKLKLIRAVARYPRLAAFVKRRLDRTRAGGLLLTIGFGGVFLAALWVGAVFDMIDNGSGFARLDSIVAEYGARNANAAAFDVYALFTRLGGTPFVTLVAIVVGGWGWWRFRNPHVALFIASVTIGQALLNNGLKMIVERERPGLAQLAPWAGSSFPSGHAAAATATFAAVAFILTLESGRRTKAVAGGVAAFMAFGVAATRALLGVHWVTDVITGMAVWFGWFLICAVAFGGRVMRFGQPRDEIARRAPSRPAGGDAG